MLKTERKVRDFIAQEQLLDIGQLYLVALSGGADSVCLLLILQKLGYRIEAVHCNFQLRGDESQRDEQFVQTLCRQHDVPLHLAHFDTRTYAQLHKVSIEVAARELRYRYFEQLRQDIDAAGICVAHHRDDSVETILLNLIRGTGLRGLTGIKPLNNHVIRPMLRLGREEIEEYLEQAGQSYVTDSTNLDSDEATRNKIRLQVLPLLREINPSVSESINETANRLAEAGKVVDSSLSAWMKAQGGAVAPLPARSLSIQSVLQFPSPELLLFELLYPYGFTPDVIRQLSFHLEASTGSLYQSPTHELLVDRRHLVIEPRSSKPLPTLRIPEAGRYLYESKGYFTFTIVHGRQLSTEVWCASLDASKVNFPLSVRPCQTGDRFVPFGMKGSRLVSDFLTDRKLSLFEKRRQLVVTDSEGEIVWVVGQRPDHRFCLDSDTQETLIIQFCKD